MPAALFAGTVCDFFATGFFGNAFAEEVAASFFETAFTEVVRFGEAAFFTDGFIGETTAFFEIGFFETGFEEVAFFGVLFLVSIDLALALTDGLFALEGATDGRTFARFAASVKVRMFA